MFLNTITIPLLGSIRATLDQPVFPGKILVWLLFMLSIIGWVMIISKIVQLTKIKRVDRLFTERLRKSKTTLEVFEEGWSDELSLKHVIYQSGAREAAYQLLGSREPQEMMQRRIKQAGKLAGRQLDFLKLAFHTGFRAAVGRLQSGIEGLRLLTAAALLTGTFGLVWTLMSGFDKAKEFSEIAPMVGGALGYFTLSILVAAPAILARIGFQATVRMRKQELDRFRDDINRLFERSFAEIESPVRPTVPESGSVIKPSLQPENEIAPGKSNDGKKYYHSIRERLLRGDSGDEDERFEVNPIARQAASMQSY